MPGEIATFLLGAQGGVAADFARLHAATNPVLLRYLRVTADGDHAELARTAWTTALPQLQVCSPDEDAWLELVVGAARTAVRAARTAVRAGRGASSLAPAGSSPAPAGSSPAPAGPSTTPSGDEPDALSEAVAALRACPPPEAEVLAMGAVANLGREAVSRLTGLEPNAVLALVLQAQRHLPVSLETLIDSLRVPATPGELADLPFAAGLFSAGLPVSPAAAAPAARSASVAPMAALGTAATTAASVVPVGTLQQASVVEIHSLQSSAPASAQKTLGTPSRSARAGAAAAAWLLAVGGISTAAAMSGLLSVAIDGILGRDRGPVVTADGPIVPGPLPTTERPSGPPTPGRVPTPTPTPGSDSGPGGGSGGGGGDQVVDLPGGPTRIQVVVATFNPDAETPSTPTDTPTPTPTPTPTEPPATPPPPVTPTPTTPRPSVVPASHGNGHGNGNGKSKGKGNRIGQAHTTHQGKHLAKGHAKQATKHHGKHQAKAHAKQAAKQHGKHLAKAAHSTSHVNQGKH